MRLIITIIMRYPLWVTLIISTLLGGYAMQTPQVRQVIIPFIYEKSKKLGLTLETVKVAGNHAITTEDILSIIALPQGYPMVAIDSTKIREKLQNVGWIKSASISKQLPNTLVVKITERTPIAIWQNKGGYQLIGSEGHLMGTQGITQYLDLLLLVGDNAPSQMEQLQLVLNEMPRIKKTIKTASWISGRRWTLTTKSGIEILLPAQSPMASAKYLAKLQRRKNILERDIIRIDLRIQDRVIVKLRTTKVEPVPQPKTPEQNSQKDQPA